MSDLFFGQTKNFRSYHRDGEKVNLILIFHCLSFNNQYKIVDVEDSLFGAIILDISKKDLYSSVDAWLNFDIEDFRAPNVLMRRKSQSYN